MTDRIDPAVHPVKPVRGDPVVDLVLRRPDRTQLVTVDAPALPRRKCRDRRIHAARFTLSRYMRAEVKLAAHPPRIGGLALRDGRVCCGWASACYGSAAACDDGLAVVGDRCLRGLAGDHSGE